MTTIEAEILNELRRLNQILTSEAKDSDRSLDAKGVAARYNTSLRAAERILKKHGIRVDRELRIPLRTLRKLEESGPHFLATYGR